MGADVLILQDMEGSSPICQLKIWLLTWPTTGRLYLLV